MAHKILYAKRESDNVNRSINSLTIEYQSTFIAAGPILLIEMLSVVELFVVLVESSLLTKTDVTLNVLDKSRVALCMG